MTLDERNDAMIGCIYELLRTIYEPGCDDTVDSKEDITEYQFHLAKAMADLALMLLDHSHSTERMKIELAPREKWDSLVEDTFNRHQLVFAVQKSQPKH